MFENIILMKPLLSAGGGREPVIYISLLLPSIQRSREAKHHAAKSLSCGELSRQTR
jgi:hypothetical protein